MYIDSCIKNLKEIFPEENWQIEFIDEESGEINDSEKLIGLFITFTDNIFKNLNLSLLSGEYIEHPNYLDKIEEFKNGLNAIYLDYAGNHDRLNMLGNDINEHVLSPIRSVLDRLIHSYKNTENNIEGLRKFIFVYKKKIPSHGGQILNIDLTSNINLINLNLDLCSLDRRLRVSKEVYEKLLFAINSLREHFKTDIFQQPLIDKANFLLLKLEFRLNDDDVSYEINSNEVSAPKEIEAFNQWIGTINEHYEEIGRKSIKFKSQIEDLYPQNVIKKFSEYQKLIKYYKDDITDDYGTKYKRVLNVTKQFKKQYSNLKSSGDNLLDKFNHRAYRISLNYYNNNVMSLAVKESILDENLVNKLYSRISEYQHKYKLGNYFHHEKMAEYLSSKLENEFSKSEKDYSIIETNISKLEDVLKSAEKNYEWCLNRDFLIHQLPFEECLVDYKINESTSFKMFIYSSFILPLNYDLNHNSIKDLTENLRKFKLLKGFHENIEDEMTIIQQNRHSIENADKKNIEILSIFSAVVLFTIGEIQMFGELNGKEIMRFTLLFAYSLIMFILVIWLITRDYAVSKKFTLPGFHKILIGGITVATIVIFYYAI